MGWLGWSECSVGWGGQSVAWVGWGGQSVVLDGVVRVWHGLVGVVRV